jgi:N-acetylmuramoyl-L-alanine amidase
VRRKGIPDVLRMRFLDCDEEPRAGIPYLLKLGTHDGEVLAPISGELDADGYLVTPLPPDADDGVLILGKGPSRETYEIDLGWVDPIDTATGVQDRLANLGYYACCELDTVDHQVTRAALARLQMDRGRSPSGEIDEATRAELEGLHLS